MRLLRLAGFVASARGQAGGYALARPADQIKVSEVLEALGGRLYSPSFCERHSGLDRSCNHSVDCAIRALWGTVQAVLDEVLGNTTISDLAHSEMEVRQWIAQRKAAAERAGAAAGGGSSPV
jgi:Rrf2 family protein